MVVWAQRGTVPLHIRVSTSKSCSPDLTFILLCREELIIDDARAWKLPASPLGCISAIADQLPLWKEHVQAVRPSTGVIAADDQALLASAGGYSSDSSGDLELLSPLGSLAAMSWPSRPALGREQWW